MEYSETVMKKVYELRKAQKVTQEQLAQILGITYQAYAHYEKGRCKPDIDCVVKLADFFNVSIDYLLGRE